MSNEKVQLVAKALGIMFARQNEMNTKVNPDWLAANYPFHRACWTECGEAMGYLEWEWWKTKNEDTGNFSSATAMVDYCVELVDALHFAISMILQEQLPNFRTRVDGPQAVADFVVGQMISPTWGAMGVVFKGDPATGSLVENTENAALCALYRLPLPTMTHLINAAALVGIGLHGLFAFYLGKHALNMFRQDNGYKVGKYRKFWGSTESGSRLEDNAFLAPFVLRWLAERDEHAVWVDAIGGGFADSVTKYLSATYANVLAGNAVEPLAPVAETASDDAPSP